MKKEITVWAYANEMRGRRPRHPLVHILGFDYDGAELSSFTFKPDQAEQLCVAIRRAARAARRGKSRDYAVKLEDWQ
jgi:hypothetical protein